MSIHKAADFTLFAHRALIGEAMCRDVRMRIRSGNIAAVDVGATAGASDIRVDTVLPAISNLHSHTFQRAMAGMTEHRVGTGDSFWTWRTLMYRFLDRLRPEHVEAIAAYAFLEMVEAGYAAVGEFHYVHHQAGGAPYDNLGELSDRIMAAAQHVGLGLTHLPVLYTYGGAGEQALADGQRRFGNDPDRFLSLLDHCRTAATTLPADTRVGIAPHSLRATSAADLARVLGAVPDGPIHIHISEQPKEVADISAWLGARPVAWLLANQPVDRRWCLIHATHMTPAETNDMARSGAVAGLCPITESNLGDGLFNGAAYLADGGAFGVGSDSNIRVSMTEELRTLEYGQRLRNLARNVMRTGDGSVGTALYTGAAAGGAQALDRCSGTIAPGQLADLVAIDTSGPTLGPLLDDQIVDGLIFAADDRVVTDVWSAGRQLVAAGRHPDREPIIAAYSAAVADLLADA